MSNNNSKLCCIHVMKLYSIIWASEIFIDIRKCLKNTYSLTSYGTLAKLLSVLQLLYL